VLSVEEPGDYLFEPAGVVILLHNRHYQVYCTSANHNRFKAALNRFAWGDLENGVVYRETSYRLTDVTQEMARRGWLEADNTPDILRHLYEENPRHLFFLAKSVRKLTDLGRV
jgi:hypothetical protein